MASEGNNFVWCQEMVELATGPTPDINERHMCSKGEHHTGHHECNCTFAWETLEAPC